MLCLLANGNTRPSGDVYTSFSHSRLCVDSDGVRLAVDYHYVNKYTAYPMSDLQSLFQSVFRISAYIS